MGDPFECRDLYCQLGVPSEMIRLIAVCMNAILFALT